MKEKFNKIFKDLDEIKTKEATKEAKQARGRAFESLLLDVFEHEGILQKRNRHTKDNKSEEIDGVIDVYHRIFLIEAKWVTSGLAASVLYSFIGKIENKFHGTLGVFISRNPLKKNFLRALNKGRRQSVIVIHGKDVDLLFESNVTFKEYIEYAFKELSSENVVHLPVEEFIKNRDLKDATKVLIDNVETGGKRGLQFVKEELLSKQLSQTEMLVELAGLGEEEKEKAFEFVFETFSDLWSANFSGDGKPFVLKNIYEFLSYHKPKPGTLKKLAPLYYKNLIFKSFTLYTRLLFIELFKNYYPGLSEEDRKEFEKSILVFWKNNFGTYEAENNVTNLLEPNWSNLTDELKAELYKGYLDIYVSDRKSNHPQKKYAIELVDGSKIPLKIVKEWLSNKLKVSNNMYTTISTEKIAFIISTYKGVLKMVEPNEKKWADYVADELYTRKTVTAGDSLLITLTDEQKLNLVYVQGSNGENLLNGPIGITYTNYQGFESASQYIDLVTNALNLKMPTNDKIMPVNLLFSNAGYDKTEIKFENLNKIELKVVYRLLN